MAGQLSLFSQRSFNITRELKESLAAMVRESGLSRDEFVDRMNLLAERFGVRLVRGNGRGLSMATFEKWINPEDNTHNPCVAALPIFCQVGGSIAPLAVLAGPVGVKVIDDSEQRLLKWAREYHKARSARQAMKKLEAEL